MHRLRLLPCLIGAALIASAGVAHAQFPITMGTSWDGLSLQEILDLEYGPGVINVATDYEGYLPGDADPGYWEDLGVDAIIVREVAGYADANDLGWYLETLSGPPVIDGVDDGIILEGPISAGQSALVTFPAGVIRFGLYLNPNGPDSGINAPEPELFFTNRFYNDLGPDGSGSPHPPFDGDVQCLIFNISDLRGRPAYVVAWEDLDSGAPISPTYNGSSTDNDFQDLVIEVEADSPVTIDESSWGRVKSLFERN